MTTPVLPFALPSRLNITEKNGCKVLINAPFDWNDDIKHYGGRWSSTDRGWILPRNANIEDVLKPELPFGICCRKAHSINSQTNEYKCLDNCDKFKAIQDEKTRDAELQKKRATMYSVEVRMKEGTYRVFEHETYTTYYDTLEDATKYVSSLDIGKWERIRWLGGVLVRQVESARIVPPSLV